MIAVARSWMGRLLLAVAVTFGAATSALADPTPAVLQVDVTGIQSVDPFNDPLNVVLTYNLPSGARVTGIGWDVTQEAFTPSFLSEMVVGFSTSTGLAVTLTPGVGDTFSGTGAYSSGGIVDLIGLGLDFLLQADGILNLQFFESFDDFANAADGVWKSGTISVRYEYDQGTPVPEPSSLALAALCLAALGLFRRRRAAPR